MKGRDVRCTKQVFALLLDFVTMPEKSRREFLSSVNEWLIMSPRQRRRMIDEWEQKTDRGASRAKDDG
ncbi:hypothetical protein Bsp3421_005370 [Burkholderia sp. FERM BP-3421]|jgi:hypothetical protein|uniref:hypothetical protein n=1 Tax=Burkholderia sp. FERM BP-3421 TaxID=1494466 RepID=UPI00235E3D33|nr:hypothetical protein [Burkholderia sp. FERM BP-3421]WDD95205.1 hypothetical protein Bsp3421_005370 [Burkholderia sp. FERM BP-3421]